jgi:hypothetical protein
MATSPSPPRAVASLLLLTSFGNAPPPPPGRVSHAQTCFSYGWWGIRFSSSHDQDSQIRRILTKFDEMRRNQPGPNSKIGEI